METMLIKMKQYFSHDLYYADFRFNGIHSDIQIMQSLKSIRHGTLFFFKVKSHFIVRAVVLTHLIKRSSISLCMRVNTRVNR